MITYYLVSIKFEKRFVHSQLDVKYSIIYLWTSEKLPKLKISENLREMAYYCLDKYPYYSLNQLHTFYILVLATVDINVYFVCTQMYVFHIYNYVCTLSQLYIYYTQMCFISHLFTVYCLHFCVYITVYFICVWVFVIYICRLFAFMFFYNLLYLYLLFRPILGTYTMFL